MLIFLNGLILGLSLIIALGPQNVFLIRQSAQGQHPYLSASVCFFSDLILVCSSVLGLHQLFKLYPNLQIWLTGFGIAFLVYYGFKAFRQALTVSKDKKTIEIQKTSRWQIIFLALGFSLLNPHAIIDTLVIIGSGSSLYPDNTFLFLIGIITASFLWFFSLTLTTQYFAGVLTKVAVWRRIEFSSGLMMFYLGFKLTKSLF